jgi:hypothetical protein
MFPRAGVAKRALHTAVRMSSEGALPKIPASLEDRSNETRITRISRVTGDASMMLGGGRRGHGFAAEDRRLGAPTEGLGCGRGPRVARP